jgi:hypothetical protein
MISFHWSIALLHATMVGLSCFQMMADNIRTFNSKSKRASPASNVLVLPCSNIEPGLSLNTQSLWRCLFWFYEHQTNIQHESMNHIGSATNKMQTYPQKWPCHHHTSQHNSQQPASVNWLSLAILHFPRILIGFELCQLDRNYTAMHTNMQRSVHMSALLITWVTWGDG